MNNEEFRKLMLVNSAKSNGSKANGSSSSSNRPAGGTGSLGSRQKSSIPMTPRSVGGGRVDFARQLAERNQEPQKQKKFRTAAPKGSKLAEGYVDRSKQRPGDEADDRASRLQALEESLKKEEIDQETYEKLRFQIAGGDLSSTHLVKGLDFKLLARIRQGEDVYGDGKATEKSPEPEAESEPDEDVDEALERLEESEVHTVTKEKTQKKGQFTTTAVAGTKRSRDQILAEMRAAREAAKAKDESALGMKFKKIGSKKTPGSRIERDGKGREVLIITDEDGNERRKVRKVAVEDAKEREAFVPPKAAEVLGMEVPEFYQKKLQREAQEAAAKEVNIFDDVDSDYDPLAGIGSESDSSEDESDKSANDAKEQQSPTVEDGEIASSPPSEAMPPPKIKAPPASRNYFGDSKTPLAKEDSRSTTMSDPLVLAALRKAKAMNAATKSEEEQKDTERQERLKKLMQNNSRDDMDMDLGFGTNRVEDEADLEEDHVKLSAWGDEDDGDGKAGGKSKRKRGGKKRKGDVNSAADVLGVLERRKAAGS